MYNQQSYELFQLQRFLPDLLKDESYTISQPNPPLPDILIQLSDKEVGIEMTALVVNEQLVQMEKSQEAILSEAQKIFEEQCQLPLHISVSFIDEASWKKRDCKHVAKFLASVVNRLVQDARNLPSYDKQFDVEAYDLEHAHIHRVSIFYLEQLTVSCWSPLRAFWVPKAPVDQLQELINRKNKNIAGYLSGCNEVWLLVIETGAPSSYSDQFDQLQTHVFESGFTQTMVGRIATGELIMLKTKSVS